MAFEPDPTNFAVLAENVAVNGYRNIELFNLAVSDRSGPLRLHKCPDNAGDHRVWSSEERRDAVEVRAVALDDLFGGHPPRVAVIKMDVQGAELRACRGMDCLLSRQPHLALATEFWPRGLAGAGGSSDDYVAFLTGHGFRLHLIDESRRQLIHSRPTDLPRLIPPGSDDFLNLLAVKG